MLDLYLQPVVVLGEGCCARGGAEIVIPMKCGFRDCFQVNGSVWSHYCKLAYGKYKNK